MDRVTVSCKHGHSECADRPRLILHAHAARGQSMMESERWPLDAVSAAALVARVIDDVDKRPEEDTVVLLSGLLCTAWPSRWAQDQ